MRVECGGLISQKTSTICILLYIKLYPLYWVLRGCEIITFFFSWGIKPFWFFEDLWLWIFVSKNDIWKANIMTETIFKLFWVVGVMTEAASFIHLCDCHSHQPPFRSMTSCLFQDREIVCCSWHHEKGN